MSYTAILAIDMDRLLLASAVTLKEAREVLVYFGIQKKSETQNILPTTVTELRKMIGTQIELAVGRKEFVCDVLDDQKFMFIHNSQATYDFSLAEVELKDIFCWARGKNIFIPDHIYSKFFPTSIDSALDPIEVSVEKESYESLSGSDKSNLERLKRESSKWEEAIVAAVKASWNYSQLEEGEIITRAVFERYIYSEGHKTLPTTTIDKIWKALPERIKSRGGRPKGAKDAH